MSYLVPRESFNTRQLILVLAFGQLSLLEAYVTLSDEVETMTIVCDRIAIANLSNESSRKISKLAGVYKVAIPHSSSPLHDSTNVQDAVASILEYKEGKFNVSLSMYCTETIDAAERYDDLVSALLTGLREGGAKKVNLIRPRQGYEAHMRDILARMATDIVAFPYGRAYVTGTTAYIPDVSQFQKRATEKPSVSSAISLSPRLAKLLVNLAALSPGGSLLDPFCGSGTILSEAVLAGIDCTGFDKNPARISDAKKNLEWIASQYRGRLGSHSLAVGDATKLQTLLGGKRVDAVVTEPILLPTFTSTPTLDRAKRVMRKVSMIYSECLYSISEVVKRSGRIVMVAPSLKTTEGRDVSVSLQDVGEIGFRELQPRGSTQEFRYPIRIPFESTRWIKRMVYVFERV